MLLPTKNTLSSSCLLAITAHVAARLRARRALAVDEICMLVDERFGVGGRSSVLDALCVLYGIGVVAYRAKTDMIEYVKKS